MPRLTAGDLTWLVLFAALALASPVPGRAEVALVGALLAWQLAEPRVALLATPRGRALSIGIKLALGFLLVGYTRGIASSYYVILLLPVLTAATGFGARGTALVTVIAGAAYLVFLHPWFLGPYEVSPEGAREVALRVVFLGLVAAVTHGLAAERRVAAGRAERAATALAAANQSLAAAERHAERAERLAALGQLTAGLAHELRNPLGTIRASADLLRQRLGSEGVPGELAGYITGEVDRASSLISRFLDFARPLEAHREPADLHEAIDRAIDRAGPLPVAIYRNYSPEVRPFALDAELVERAVQNLIVNAAEASPPDVSVTVKTRLAAGGVEVAVIDRGSGIALEHREAIFNPFFTTKPAGTGLGLPVVARIAAEHGGSVTVETELGQGTVFRLWLPLPPP